jgi:hypothetical protein
MGTMLDDKWVCHCDEPPVECFPNEPTGLCAVCGLIYDEPMYALYLRGRLKSFTNVQEFLGDVDWGRDPGWV